MKGSKEEKKEGKTGSRDRADEPSNNRKGKGKEEKKIYEATRHFSRERSFYVIRRKFRSYVPSLTIPPSRSSKTYYASQCRSGSCDSHNIKLFAVGFLVFKIRPFEDGNRQNTLTCAMLQQRQADSLKSIKHHLLAQVRVRSGGDPLRIPCSTLNTGVVNPRSAGSVLRVLIHEVDTGMNTGRSSSSYSLTWVGYVGPQEVPKGPQRIATINILKMFCGSPLQPGSSVMIGTGTERGAGH
ncbi:Hypothetical predicted protein [Pelobates cultripes]|uniref:Uncharacterized protein n=1 Tax=Pelobates cultripes TaxID=61616 RepID=A0AAD1WRY3_PELCU|nr:Hypothetical predicted protein [Pelobates cultripes]